MAELFLGNVKVEFAPAFFAELDPLPAGLEQKVDLLLRERGVVHLQSHGEIEPVDLGGFFDIDGNPPGDGSVTQAGEVFIERDVDVVGALGEPVEELLRPGFDQTEVQRVIIVVMVDLPERNFLEPRGSGEEGGFIGKGDDILVIVIVRILDQIKPFQTGPNRVPLVCSGPGGGVQLDVGGAEVGEFEPDLDSEGNVANAGLERRRQGQCHFDERADSDFRLKRGSRNFHWHRLGTILERPTIDGMDARTANIVEWLTRNDRDGSWNAAPIRIEEVEFVVGMSLGRAFQMPSERRIRQDNRMAILSHHMF